MGGNSIPKSPPKAAISRRSLLSAAGAAAFVASAHPAAAQFAQQVTDLEGLDGLWRNAEDAIRNFFGNVTFLREGIHLDLPQHADVGSAVPLTVRIDSAMTPDDYPVVVHVVADKNPTPHVLSAWFLPEAGRAEFSTRIRLEITQTVTAVAEMRDGRHLRVDREVAVSFGACGQIGTGTQAEIYAFQPKTRVNVPATAAPGDIVPVRAVISHPQETGFRYTPTLDRIRQRIVSHFSCRYNGVEFFRTRPYPAVATNPYFLFYVRAQGSGTFDFHWHDSRGHDYYDHAAIVVA